MQFLIFKLSFRIRNHNLHRLKKIRVVIETFSVQFQNQTCILWKLLYLWLNCIIRNGRNNVLPMVVINLNKISLYTSTKWCVFLYEVLFHELQINLGKHLYIFHLWCSKNYHSNTVFYARKIYSNLYWL